MTELEVITQHMQHLAFQHNAGSGSQLPSQSTPAVNEADADSLMNEFRAKMNLTDLHTPGQPETSPLATSPILSEASDSDSDLETDPSLGFSSLILYAHTYNQRATSTHLLAAEMRNWFETHSMSSHHAITARIARELCLKRIEAVVVEYQASDHIERTGGAEARTEEDRKRLRQLFRLAERGVGVLEEVEQGLLEVCGLSRGGWDGEVVGEEGWERILGMLEEVERVGIEGDESESEGESGSEEDEDEDLILPM